MANRFWIGGTGTWDNSTTTQWSTTTGGAGGASVPVAGDAAIFDALSGGGTVTPNYDMNIGSIQCGAFTGTLDFSANNNNPTLIFFNGSGSGTRTINLGDGLWSLTGKATTTQPWTMTTTTNLTFNANRSTLKMTATALTAMTFAGGGLTYNRVWFSNGTDAGTKTITGSNTYKIFKDDGTGTHTLSFTAGTTQTFTIFDVSGIATHLISLNSTSTATYAFVKSGGGVSRSDFLNIQHCVATPARTWYAGNNSTNNQGVATAGSGWIFTTSPGDFFQIF